MTKWALVLLAAVAVGSGCGKPSTPAAAYTIEAAPVAAKLGEKIQAVLRFVPREGLHWNEEFPARAKLDATAGLEPEKSDFQAADFKIDGKTGTLAIPLIARQAGAMKLRAQTDFAMCDEKGCQFFRGVPVEVQVNAQ